MSKIAKERPMLRIGGRVIVLCCLLFGSVMHASVASGAEAAGRLISAEPAGTYSQKQMDEILRGEISGVNASLYRFEPSRNEVVLYKVHYLTSNPLRGNEREQVSGLVAFPVGGSKAASVLIYMHGTELSRHGVPSNPEKNIEARAVIAAFAGRGYAVFMPDYIGKGDSSVPHTYVMADAEAQASYDLLTAGKVLAKEKNIALAPKIFLSGWSQGGHAAMALMRLMQDNHVSDLVAAAPIAGAYDIYLTWCQALVHNPSSKLMAIMAYVIFAYEDYYHLRGLTAAAEQPQFRNLGKTFFERDDLTLDDLKRFGRSPQELLEAKFNAEVLSSANAFSRAMQANQVYQWKPGASVRFYYGEADDIVPAVVTQTAYDYMKSLNADVSRESAGKRAGHTEAFVFALRHAPLWFEGVKPPQNAQ